MINELENFPPDDFDAEEEEHEFNDVYVSSDDRRKIQDMMASGAIGPCDSRTFGRPWWM